MTFELKKLPGFNLIGVELRTTNIHDRAMQEIPLFWERFVREKTFQKIPNPIDLGTIVGVYMDYDKEGFYSLIIGTAVSSLDSVPDGFVAKVVPDEQHAVMEMKGAVSTVVPEAWSKVWSSSFPYKRKFSYDCEIYNIHSSVDAEREITLCVSVI